MNILKTIKKKLSKIKPNILLLIIVAMLVQGITIIQYFFALNGIRDGMELRARGELNAKRLEIQRVTEGVEIAVRNMVWAVEKDLSATGEEFEDLQRLLDNNADIFGCGIGFIADYFPEHGRWHEPYMTRNEDGTYRIDQIGTAQHDYLNADWFINGMASDSGYWSEPYYDDAGAHASLCTFAYPLRDASGKKVAVLGIDLSLEWLSKLLNNNPIFPESHNLMISKTGQLLACPTESLVMRSTIQEATKRIEDTTAQYINHEMMTGKSGKAKVEDEDGVDYQVYYAPMEHGWSMAVVCNEKVMLHQLQRVTNNLFALMLLSLLLIGFILWRIRKGFMRLQKVNQEKERISSELNIASSIQKGMLPKVFPPYPNRDDVEIYGSLVSAKEVGGDLYDFYIRDEKLFFCIGDVSGKGVPASLVMAVTRSLFRTVLAHESMPERIVASMNDAMTEMNEENMFVTFFVGVLDLPTGRLRYCNAGHCPPLIVSEKKELLPVNSNIPIGLMEGWKFTGQEKMLNPKTVIFLYTDGLTEAENNEHEQFGEERMIDVANHFHLKYDAQATDDVNTPVTEKENNAERIIHEMTDAVHAFVNDAEQSDDLTMLSVEFTKQHYVEVLTRSLHLHNDVNEVPLLASFVDEVCEALGFDAPTTMQMNLAMEEAVVNVMNYAYPAGTVGDITIEAVASERRMKFVIIDSGAPFDPTEQAEVDTSLGVDERPIGGLGIHLVRQLMDSINYERTGGRNILTLRKMLSNPANNIE